jgi:hypothetical protein
MSQPEATFRSGNCSASVFRNTRQDGDRVYDQVSIAFQKRYRDKDGEWKSASSLNVSDLADAILVLDEAMRFTKLRETNGE